MTEVLAAPGPYDKALAVLDGDAGIDVRNLPASEQKEIRDQLIQYADECQEDEDYARERGDAAGKLAAQLDDLLAVKATD